MVRTRCAGLLLALATLIQGCGETEPPGPLTPEGPIAPYATARLVSVKEPFSWSGIVVFNSGDMNAVLDSVELVNATEEIKLVDALAAYVHGQPEILRSDGAPTFPPSFSARYSPEFEDLEGFVVPPSSTTLGGDGVQLVLGLTAEPGDEGVFQGVELTYHVDDRVFRYVFPYGLRACGPPGQFRAQDAPPCRAPQLLSS
ncbi:MAG TPA: hypothetical protein VGA93_02895 [Actinomycetota bacterium]